MMTAVLELAVCIVLGALLGAWLWTPLWGVCLALMLWSLRELFQRRQLALWLQRDDSTLPHRWGSWGRINALLRNHRHSAEDRTERHYKNHLDLYEEIFVGLDDAVVSIDRDHRIIWCNERATALLGLNWPEVRSRSVTILLRQPELVEKLLSGEDCEMCHSSPVNPSTLLQSRIMTARDGVRLLLARDITLLSAAEHSQRRFLSDISHELRTPLTVLLTHLEILGGVAEVGKKQLVGSEVVEDMLGQSQRMKSLLDDLLRLERGAADSRADASALELKGLFERIVENCRLIFAAGPKLQVRVDQGVTLWGREDDVYSVVHNLIDNAMRHTDAETGTVTVSAEATDDGIVIAVDDDGCGIEAVHLPLLCERFYRVDPGGSRNGGGTGLGLAIVKQILEHYRARLEIDSSPGKGSTFRCLFPAS